MPDLLTVRRTATHGARADIDVGLPTAFGVPTAIRPATTSAPGTAAVGAPVAAAGAAMSGPGASALATPGSTTGPAGRGTPSLGAAPNSRPAPRREVAERGRAVMRSLLPAPPPVSLRPSAHAGPPVPAAGSSSSSSSSATIARSAVATAGAGAASAIRRSALADASADLFRADDLTTAISRKLATEGQAAMPSESRGLQLVRPPTASSPPTPGPGAAEAILADPRQLEELVDAVVDRIERRVVDELERRGRRHDPGVF
jgi:hypothetical protein